MQILGPTQTYRMRNARSTGPSNLVNFPDNTDTLKFKVHYLRNVRLQERTSFFQRSKLTTAPAMTLLGCPHSLPRGEEVT
jgi:hypothetical protein